MQMIHAVRPEHASDWSESAMGTGWNAADDEEADEEANGWGYGTDGWDDDDRAPTRRRRDVRVGHDDARDSQVARRRKGTARTGELTAARGYTQEHGRRG